MEWALLVFAFIIAGYLYFFQRIFFDKHKGFIEFGIVLFTVFFTIYQLNSSTEDFDKIVNRMEGIINSAEESKRSLKEVEKSLSDLPTQIDSFSKSIYLLNNVVSQQRDKLEITLNDFNSSIKGFQGSVDNMAKRFDRLPKLKIDLKKDETDSTVIINGIVITNYGDLIANAYALRMQIEEKFLISFEMKNSRQTFKQGSMLSYQIDYDNQLIGANSHRPLVLIVKFK